MAAAATIDATPTLADRDSQRGAPVFASNALTTPTAPTAVAEDVLAPQNTMSPDAATASTVPGKVWPQSLRPNGSSATTLPSPPAAPLGLAPAPPCPAPLPLRPPTTTPYLFAATECTPPAAWYVSPRCFPSAADRTNTSPPPLPS